MSKRRSPGYDYHTDRAITALVATSRSLVGDTKQARDLILALCDQAGASLEVQQAIRTLLKPAWESCSNCGLSTHARCCAWCGKPHKPSRLENEHCSDKCERAAARADKTSDQMEEDHMAQSAKDQP